MTKHILQKSKHLSVLPYAHLGAMYARFSIDLLYMLTIRDGLCMVGNVETLFMLRLWNLWAIKHLLPTHGQDTI